MKQSIFTFNGDAKTLLREHRRTAVQAILTYAVLSYAFSLLSEVFTFAPDQTVAVTLSSLGVLFFTTLMLGPIKTGVASVFCDIASGDSPKSSDVFLWYGEGTKFKRSMMLALLQTLILSGLVILFAAIVFGAGYLIAPDIFAVPTQITTMEGYNALMSAAYSIVFMLALVLILTYAVYSMFIPSIYLLADNPDLTARECLKISRKLTKPVRFKLFGLIATFALRGLGYIVLFSVVLAMFMQNQTTAVSLAAIPSVLVILFKIMPHFHLTMVLLVRDLVSQNEKGA